MTDIRRVLVIGGTQFIGRATVCALLESGANITLLNRGRSPSPFEDEKIRTVLCDRHSTGFATFLNSEPAWDAIVDFAAFEPADLQPIIALGSRAGLYVFISSDSVYQACAPAGFVYGPHGFLTEESCSLRDEVRAREDEYGANKLACEELLQLHTVHAHGTASLTELPVKIPFIAPHQASFFCGRKLWRPPAFGFQTCLDRTRTPDGCTNSCSS